jgi:galactose-1-phosphate uridylyltransferase
MSQTAMSTTDMANWVTPEEAAKYLREIPV